jgi:hypothetical protein
MLSDAHDAEGTATETIEFKLRASGGSWLRHVKTQLRDVAALGMRIEEVESAAHALILTAHAMRVAKEKLEREIHQVCLSYPPQPPVDLSPQCHMSSDSDDDTNDNPVHHINWECQGAIDLVDAVKAFHASNSQGRYPQSLRNLDLTSEATLFTTEWPDEFDTAIHRAKRQLNCERSHKKRKNTGSRGQISTKTCE